VTHIDRYTCEDVFRRLDSYLDRELKADEMALVREHLEACAQCAQEHDFERSFLDSMREKVRRIGLPEELRAKVAGAIARARGEGGD